jgi:flagellar protein FliO/FliZ
MQSDFTFNLIKMISALALVLGLMMVLYYLLRKTWWRGAGPAGSRVIQVLTHQMLGPRKGIAIVSVAGEYLVVGIGKDHVSMLGKIESREGIETLTGLGNKRAGRPFAGVLSSFLERRKDDVS